jgi:ABC-type transporter Mla maintaining outer membrane lipid asymmetry permease subunit MlaE
MLSTFSESGVIVLAVAFVAGVEVAGGAVEVAQDVSSSVKHMTALVSTVDNFIGFVVPSIVLC